jgi:hypothetical protein
MMRWNIGEQQGASAAQQAFFLSPATAAVLC